MTSCNTPCHTVDETPVVIPTYLTPVDCEPKPLSYSLMPGCRRVLCHCADLEHDRHLLPLLGGCTFWLHPGSCTAVGVHLIPTLPHRHCHWQELEQCAKLPMQASEVEPGAASKPAGCCLSLIPDKSLRTGMVCKLNHCTLPVFTAKRPMCFLYQFRDAGGGGGGGAG